MERHNLYLEAVTETFFWSYLLPVLVSSVSKSTVPSLKAIDRVLIMFNKSVMPLLRTVPVRGFH